MLNIFSRLLFVFSLSLLLSLPVIAIETVDTSQLTLIDGADYTLERSGGRTDRRTRESTDNYILTNISNKALTGAITLEVIVTPNAITHLVNTDKESLSGNSVLIITEQTIQPGESVNYSLVFASPGRSRYTYVQRLYSPAEAHKAPKITSVPLLQATENERYSYTVTADFFAQASSVAFSVTQAPNGLAVNTVSGEITWTPTSAQIGNKNITVVATDNLGLSDSQTFSIQVIESIPNNNPPVAQPSSISMDEDEVKRIIVNVVDPENDDLTYAIVQAPSHGLLTGSGPSYEYTPNANYNGQDFFSFKASDAEFTSSTESVMIVVLPINDKPVAQDFNADVDEDNVLALNLYGDDADNDTLSFHIVQAPANGALIGNGSSLQYTPNENFYGTDSFSYIVRDNQEDSLPGKIQITVKPVNDAPFFTELPSTSAQELELYSEQVSTDDVDQDPVNIQLITGPTNLQLSPENNLVWTPKMGDEGEHTVTLIATDALGASEELNFIIKVAPRSESSLLLAVTSHTNEQVVTQKYVDIVGELHTLLPVSQLSVKLGNASARLSPIDEDSYLFVFSDIALTEGMNNLNIIASSSVQTSTSVQQHLIYTPLLSNPKPEIEIKSPRPGSFVAEQNFIVSGVLHATSPVTSFTINAVSIYLIKIDSDTYHFNYPAKFIDPQLSLAVLAQLENGEVDNKDITYNRDATVPVIILDNTLELSPAVNTVRENPYQLSGIVTDENLSSLTINGEIVHLEPMGTDQFTFELSLNLAEKVGASFELRAYDLSGNITAQQFELFTQSETGINIIAPIDESKFFIKGEGDSFNLQVVARINGVQGTDKVRLKIDQGTAVFAEIKNDLINTTVPVTSGAGEHTLTIEMVNELNQVISKSTQKFTLTSEESIPLKLIKTVPANGTLAAEPHEAIEIYVNKAIDPSLLTFEVRETVNGKTYINSDAPGTNFLAAKGYQLTDVIRNNVLVSGGLGTIPGDNVFTFYPHRDLAYGGSISVNVIYDGTELSRFSYRIRELPTFLTGLVFDQFSQGISGIKVELPELGRVTTTDVEGVFNFGAGDSSANTLPGGSFKLVINNNFNNPVFGVTTRNVVIEKGRHAQLNKIIVPMLNKEQAFTLLQSGSKHVLAFGELNLDLTGAQLTFPDNTHTGLAQVSFVDISEADVTPTQKAYPMSLYAFQPAGIKVSGKVSLSIEMLKIYNSFDYVPANGSYVVLVGRKGESNAVQPVGVGKIEGYTINSVGGLDINSLDFIGYALVQENKQEALKQYADGQISIQALIGKL